MLRRLIYAIAVMALAPAMAVAAPEAELWEHWAAEDPASRLKVDHSAWTGFLGKYLRHSPGGISRVAYSEVTPGDRAALEGYIESLAALRPTALRRAAQKAYWINLYNALTVKVVLDHPGVRSIRDIDISPGLFANGPWDAKLISVEGLAVSLNDIEHRILRPIWRDPRVHYAVNCASLSCPNIPARALTAENSEGFLETGARQYINHARGVSIRDGRLEVSSIFKWYKDDFGGSDEALIVHLRQYADPELSEALKGVGRISGHSYDWGLNE